MQMVGYNYLIFNIALFMLEGFNDDEGGGGFTCRYHSKMLFRNVY